MKTVIEMAREVGIDAYPDNTLVFESECVKVSIIERFVELIRADEREACAKVCEGTPKIRAYGNNRALQDECAAAIRARKTQ
jgi:hypothetical protein